MVEENKSARIINFNLAPKRYGQNRIVGNVVNFLSRNTYGLLIAGVVTLMISLMLISIACVYRSSRLRNSIKSKRSTIAYKQVSNSDDEEASLTIHDNSNRGNHSNEKIGSKITRFINVGGSNNHKISLDRLNDNEEEDEEETFSR